MDPLKQVIVIKFIKTSIRNSIIRDSIKDKNLLNIKNRLYRPHWR